MKNASLEIADLFIHSPANRLQGVGSMLVGVIIDAACSSGMAQVWTICRLMIIWSMASSANIGSYFNIRHATRGTDSTGICRVCLLQ